MIEERHRGTSCPGPSEMNVNIYHLCNVQKKNYTVASLISNCNDCLIQGTCDKIHLEEENLSGSYI